MKEAVFGLLLLSTVGCASTGARSRHGQPDPSASAVMVGDMQLEEELHRLDLLEAEIYAHSPSDAPGSPRDRCADGDREVLSRMLAFKVMMGKQKQDDWAAASEYYGRLQSGTPEELLPAIYLRRYYFEGLLECVRGLTGAAPRKAGENHHVSMLTRSNFDAETDRGLVLVDFMAHWCGPCKLLAPELEKLARQHRGEIRVGRVTADRHRELMERFDITSFPMLVLLKDGEEVARLDKYRAYPELLKWIRAALPDERSAPSARLLQAGPASAGDGGYGQRFVQPFAWPARLQLDDHVRRPGERVDSVHPARATYRVADGEAFSSLVRACEQPEATSTHPKVGSRT